MTALVSVRVTAEFANGASLDSVLEQDVSVEPGGTRTVPAYEDAPGPSALLVEAPKDSPVSTKGVITRLRLTRQPAVSDGPSAPRPNREW